MQRAHLGFGATATALVVGVLATGPSGAAAQPAADGAVHRGPAPGVHSIVRACSAPTRADRAACLALAVGDAAGHPVTSRRPLLAAFTPQQLEAAYDVTGLLSGGRTVAIIDAYGYPALESDLGHFRSTYSLGACTIAGGCLTVEGQDGGAPPSGTDTGWDLEQALDVDAVSSICPDCRILVIEAKSAAIKDLETAVDTAAASTGVVAISNSYIAGDAPDNPAYDHPGIAITAGTGDTGYEGGGFPAGDSTVTAVGGTALHPNGSPRGFRETAWPGSGSGCSQNARPAWQRHIDTTCTTKASADVAAAGDPTHGGLNVYDSAYGGFVQVGGTSEATPIIAAVYALSGHTAGEATRIPYGHTGHLYDITSGSNGSCGVPLCQAGKGWDGPTGVGTPHGVQGF